jgi:hypothetical protein
MYFRSLFINKKKIFVFSAIFFALLIIACSEKGPSRDEIPLIRTLLAEFETAVKEQNIAKLDSLITAEAVPLGYSPQKILENIYGSDLSGEFYTFGDREFLYVEDKGKVTCTIKADSLDTGRPVEITLVKISDSWLIKRFDLK